VNFENDLDPTLQIGGRALTGHEIFDGTRPPLRSHRRTTVRRRRPRHPRLRGGFARGSFSSRSCPIRPAGAMTTPRRASARRPGRSAAGPRGSRRDL